MRNHPWARNHVDPTQLFLGECAMGLEDHFYCLTKIGTSLLESCPLGIGPGKFLDEPKVSFGNLLKDGCEPHADPQSGTTIYRCETPWDS